MIKQDFPRLQESCWCEVLPNGLTVRVLPKPRFDKLYAVLAVNYGAVDMDFFVDGKPCHTPAGVAHYLEHKMFDLPEGNAMQGFTAYGGSPNAFTSYDMTAYYVQATEHAEENLRLLLRMVMTPYFTEESVEKERGIIAEEIKMYADSADSQVYEQLFSVMFPNHPAAIPIAGSVESIGQITAETLRQCYDAFYRPDNMILCVAGNLSPERVLEIAKECTPERSDGVVQRRTAPVDGIPCERVEREMDVAMPIFTVGVRLPELKRGDAKTEIACDLACELVAGEASDCYRRLYEKGLIDSGFYAGFESVRELAMLSFGGDSRSPDEVKDAVFQEAKRLCEQGIDAEEFERLKRSAVGRRLRELDSFGGTCNRICGYFFDGVDYLDFRTAFDAVTVQDVRQVLQAFTANRACMSVILPRQTEEVSP